jgi:hypothetical protein
MALPEVDTKDLSETEGVTLSHHHAPHVAMINHTFDLKEHPEVKDAMDESRDIVDAAIEKYFLISQGAECDPDTQTLVVRKCQKIKNLMCDSFLIPRGPKTYRIKGISKTLKQRRLREAAKKAKEEEKKEEKGMEA